MVGLPDLDSVATPALLVDRQRLTTNVEAMAERAARASVQLRPHAKTHKSHQVATLQRSRGAVGFTVASVREAEAFAAAGFDDLLLTCPPVGSWRLDRIVEIARDAKLRVALDDPHAVLALDEICGRAGVSIGYLWEVDCGVGRFGTPPGEATARQIAGVAATAEHCTFDGLMAFGGHVYRAADSAAVRAAARDERDAVLETAAALTTYGIETGIRSIGTTPTAHVLEQADGITEIRPGNYVYYDATQVAIGIVGEERCALTVLATVVSRPSRDRLILDGGSKALAAEQLSPLTDGFGIIRGHPELHVGRLFEEQAVVTVRGPCDLEPGDRVEIIPNHACAAVNLHRRMLLVEGGEVVAAWPVDVRGWDPWDAPAVAVAGERLR